MPLQSKSSINLVAVMNLDNLQRFLFPVHSLPFQQNSPRHCVPIPAMICWNTTFPAGFGIKQRQRTVYMDQIKILTLF